MSNSNIGLALVVIAMCVLVSSIFVSSEDKENFYDFAIAVGTGGLGIVGTDKR